MKYFLKLFRDYFKENFNIALYGATLLWVAFLIGINFYFDIEDLYIDTVPSGVWRSFLLFLYQAIPYYVSCYFIYHFLPNQDFFSKKAFWLISLFGFLVLGLSRGNYFAKDVLELVNPDRGTLNYIYKSSIRLIKFTITILPLGLFYLLYERRNISHFYGLSNIPSITKYLPLLLIMVPVIFAASLSPSFLNSYPKYETTYYQSFAVYYQLHSTLALYIYEMLYGLGFVTVEIFFRGFLIFSFTRFLGAQVVLPMAVTYCALHFGKPLGEAISSFFGGYILGVLALKTENIYGGIFLHVGIAWLMEFFACLQSA